MILLLFTEIQVKWGDSLKSVVLPLTEHRLHLEIEHETKRFKTSPTLNGLITVMMWMKIDSLCHHLTCLSVRELWVLLLSEAMSDYSFSSSGPSGNVTSNLTNCLLELRLMCIMGWASKTAYQLYNSLYIRDQSAVCVTLNGSNSFYNQSLA